MRPGGWRKWGDSGTEARHGPWAWIRWLETALLALLLFLMLGLGCAQILLRNLADTGMPWVDPVMRASVLWLGLLGAMAAAREARHIRIDVFQRWLPAVPRGVLDSITALATAAVCSVIAWHGGRMVADEMAYDTGRSVFLSPWMLQMIIPAAFGVIAVSYLAHTVVEVGKLFGRERS